MEYCEVTMMIIYGEEPSSSVWSNVCACGKGTLHPTMSLCERDWKTHLIVYVMNASYCFCTCLYQLIIIIFLYTQL